VRFGIITKNRSGFVATVSRSRTPFHSEVAVDKPVIDVLAERLERLERENRRWRWAAGGAALTLAVWLAVGGVVKPRALEAQQAAEPVAARMTYQVTEEIYLNQIEKPLQKLANDGWEVVQVVPTAWSGGDQGAYGSFSKGIAVLRRPVRLR
jgi:hypothetical protein